VKHFLVLIPLTLLAADWPRFRGPNGSGVAETKNLPDLLDPQQNALWRTPLPPGYSSPALSNGKLFLTAWEGPVAFTIAVDAKDGKVLWRRQAPEGRPVVKGRVNTPVSPSPVTDGESVYVFFEHFGLLSYGPDGNERWRVPMGPFKNPYGMGSSPILAGGTVVMLCDNDVDSHLLGVSAKDGKILWKAPRLEVTHGFSTPIVYQPKSGPAQIIVSGSYQLVAYSAATGEKLWWAGGMAWQAKSTPVLDGDTVYVHSWMADMSGIGLPAKIDSFADVLKANDKNGDGKLSVDEVPYKELAGLFFLFDLNQDKFLNGAEWEGILDRNNAKNGIYAIKLSGAKGDIAKNVLWRYDKSLPNIPSPLLYGGVLYVLREGGILTSLNPANGEVIKQARVPGATDSYFASPVAADGKIYLLSQPGKAAVLKAAGEWEVLGVTDLKEECWSTPAIADSRIYVRTQAALYAFGKKSGG
jgi:outer membrane protein assembly factor BamB